MARPFSGDDGTGDWRPYSVYSKEGERLQKKRFVHLKVTSKEMFVSTIVS